MDGRRAASTPKNVTVNVEKEKKNTALDVEYFLLKTRANF